MSRNIRALAERQALGRRIRAHRIALDLSHRDIAAHIGSSKATVWYVDTASKDVHTGTLIDVAAAVGLEVALVGGHHLPLLDLTADEIACMVAAAVGWLNADEQRQSSYAGVHLLAALDKLTTTEETDDAR